MDNMKSATPIPAGSPVSNAAFGRGVVAVGRVHHVADRRIADFDVGRRVAEPVAVGVEVPHVEHDGRIGLRLDAIAVLVAVGAELGCSGIDRRVRVVAVAVERDLDVARVPAPPRVFTITVKSSSSIRRPMLKGVIRASRIRSVGAATPSRQKVSCSSRGSSARPL